MRRLSFTSVRGTLADACAWCAVTGGAASLAAGVMVMAMHAGAHVGALAASALALAAMALLPSVLARRFASRPVTPIAAALITTMIAMSAASAQANAISIAFAAMLVLIGVATLIPAWNDLRAQHLQRIPNRSIERRDLTIALGGNAPMLAAALLAGLSSGVLARFQLFSICAAGPFSLSHAAASLGIVIAMGWIADRVDHRHALLALFVLRGLLLAALTLDASSAWANFAAPAFALLDALTLPALIRSSRLQRAAHAGCPGVVHHGGMLAGAALATTSWGFSQGFYTLYLLGATLNLACAYALANRRDASTHYVTPSALATRGAIELR
ncbi:conserved membrane hypothetical protein [Paraburkholderia tropica]|uniref:hypothetical protein n=1 Tax=Paraburkholderia tropica TaxID=92647 RepID=UPI001CB447D0|nr:hypothetical protein [Paraburkholderia tropica]CAG9218808.1 conserved membrane hypothetical protein [Paraburkholderia tropica]